VLPPRCVRRELAAGDRLRPVPVPDALDVGRREMILRLSCIALSAQERDVSENGNGTAGGRATVLFKLSGALGTVFPDRQPGIYATAPMGGHARMAETSPIFQPFPISSGSLLSCVRASSLLSGYTE